jgi:HEPN domain-containing protein
MSGEPSPHDTEYESTVESLFEQDWKDAQAYHRRAMQYRDAGQAFSLVFNVAAVALERYLVALCELHGVEPRSHNFITLALTLERLISLPSELGKEIKSLDKIFGICFLEDYFHGTPVEADANRTLTMCNSIKQIVCKEMECLRIPTGSCAVKNVK